MHYKVQENLPHPPAAPPAESYKNTSGNRALQVRKRGTFPADSSDSGEIIRIPFCKLFCSVENIFDMK